MADFTTPKKPYTDVKSDHIKKKIKNSEFEDEEIRKYINKLIFLECQITGEINLGYPGGMLYDKIKKNYREDYEAIYTELKPEEFKNLQRKKKRKEQEIKKKKEIRREKKEKKLEQAKKEWSKVAV